MANTSFNRQWQLKSADEETVWGKYQRGGEACITGNVGAWYESAVYWRNLAEVYERRLVTIGRDDLVIGTQEYIDLFRRR